MRGAKFVLLLGTILAFGGADAQEKLKRRLYNLTIQGNVGYGSSTYGLVIMDLKDPKNPKVTGSLMLPDQTNDVALMGRSAIVANGPNGIRVVDVGVANKPKLVASLQLEGAAMGVAASGRYAYVASGASGVHIVDLRNLDQPKVVGSLKTAGYARAVQVHGKVCYVATGRAGIEILSVKQPKAPKRLGRLDTPGSARALHLLGQYLYVADEGGGLRVVDVSKPKQPREVGSAKTIDAARSVVAHEKLVFVADANGGALIFDATAATAPKQVGQYKPTFGISRLALRSPYLFVVGGSYGLQVLDVQDPAKPRRIDTRPEKIMANVSEAELVRRLAQYAPTELGYDIQQLSATERKLLAKLIAAANVMDQLYWKQMSPDGLRLRNQLKDSKHTTNQKAYSYLLINYGRFDLLDENKPFIGSSPWFKGGTFYPEDMSKKEFEQWLRDHPSDRKAFQDTFTVIRRHRGRLEAVPYSKAYRKDLQQAGRLLNEAAALADNPTLKRFLTSRAKAFSSNDYFQSDMDWVDLDSKIEVTIGPYEVYTDRLFGYKAAFEAFVTIRNAEASRRLRRLEKELPALEQNLPIDDKHKTKERGTSSPMVVVDEIYTGGDTRAGVQTLAFNLPNDERVRKQKGSKKVMLRNVMQAKFDQILKPIAARLVKSDQLQHLTFDAYFNNILMHELAHGLGPGYIVKGGKKTTVNLALKETYSTIEEAKADIMGHYNTLHLIRKGVLPKQLEKPAILSFMAGFFRSVRFGATKAHGRANLIEFNYLMDHGAYSRDAKTGKYSVNWDRVADGVKGLTRELLMIQALGDYEGAKQIIARYGTMQPEMKKALERLKGIPVDIVPRYRAAEQIVAEQKKELGKEEKK